MKPTYSGVRGLESGLRTAIAQRRTSVAENRKEFRTLFAASRRIPFLLTVDFGIWRKLFRESHGLVLLISVVQDTIEK